MGLQSHRHTNKNAFHTTDFHFLPPSITQTDKNLFLWPMQVVRDSEERTKGGEVSKKPCNGRKKVTCWYSTKGLYYFNSEVPHLGEHLAWPTSGWDWKLLSDHRKKKPYISACSELHGLSTLHSKTVKLPDKEPIIRGGLGSPRDGGGISPA